MLGHVSEKRIKASADDPEVGIRVIKQHELDCSDCPPGRAKRSSHSLSTAESMTAPGERVHVDLVGPMPIP